jgi:hypothetical protein
MAGATFSIVSARTGEGGTTEGGDVTRIQQLLHRAKHLDRNKINGSWKGKGPGLSPTAKAWGEFQEKMLFPQIGYVDPADTSVDRLAYLASAAGVLMVIPEKLRSASACLTLTELAIAAQIPYAWETPSGKVYSGGTKSVWGFEGRPWAILFTKGKYFDLDTEEARAFNCTSFANLMMSMWMQGNAHAKPYDANQGVGGLGKQLGPRYNMPMLKNKKNNWIFSSLEQVQERVEPGRLYQFLLCKDSTGFTKHDTVYFDGNVYQANIPSASPNTPAAVYVRPLAEVWKNLSFKMVRMYGPGPF